MILKSDIDDRNSDVKRTKGEKQVLWGKGTV
jgi:hypothetical protein